MANVKDLIVNGAARIIGKVYSSGGFVGNLTGTSSNASKVNNHTVDKDVPSNALFTDTNTWRPLGTGASDACAGNDSRLSNARPASDVYSWAKASSKPTYTASEVGALPSNGGTHIGTIQAVVDTGRSIISTINNDNLKSGTGLVMNANAGIDYGGHELANKNDINGRLSTGGGSLSGMLTTSFGGIAPCAKQAQNVTLPTICQELRVSNGCMGSLTLGTAYDIIPTSWYHYLWIPHRFGGNNGQDTGDNCAYGTMLLFNMFNANGGIYVVNYNNGNITCRAI